MPEVSEVAHVCALLRRNIIGFRIRNLTVNNDPLLFPILKGNANAESDIESFKRNLKNRVVQSVGRHGKNFWLRLKSPTHEETSVLLMHFGMTGMIKIRNIKSHLIFMENGGDKKVLEQKNRETKSKYFKSEKSEIENAVSAGNEIIPSEEGTDEKVEWPPKFVKFEMVLDDGETTLDFAFVDPRRLGRIRYLEGPQVQTDEALLNELPLSKLGPDYSKPERFEEREFTTGDPDPSHHGRPRPSLADFSKLILSKKKPIKSLLLDQDHFAGVGNWVGDEICYQARLHPNEVLSEKIMASEDGEVDPIIKRLYESIIYVCEESVRLEGDAACFPNHWLMLHRWGKRRKNSPKSKTTDGHVVDFLTVGGRTSCYVPDLQQKIKRTIKEETPSKKRQRKNPDI